MVAGPDAGRDSCGAGFYLVELKDGVEVARTLVDRFVRWPAVAVDASGGYLLERSPEGRHVRY